MFILSTCERSPLPTPRITPVETGTTFGGPGEPVQHSVGIPHSQPLPMSETRHATSQHSPNVTENNPEHALQSNSMTSSQVYYAQPHQIAPHVQLPNYPQLQAPMQHYHPSQQPTVISTPQYQAGPSSMPNIPPQALMNFLNQQSNAQFGTPPYERFSLALVDTIKAQIMPSASWDLAGQNIPQSFFNSQMMLSSSQPSQDIQAPNTFSVAPGPISNGSNEPAHIPTSRADLPPSLRRKSPVTPRSLSSKASKGKGKAATPGSPSLRDSSWFSRGATATVSPRSTQSGTLFTSEAGDELSFFVQIDLNNRFSVVSAIKVSNLNNSLVLQRLTTIRKTEVESLIIIPPQTMRFFIRDPKPSMIF